MTTKEQYAYYCWIYRCLKAGRMDNWQALSQLPGNWQSKDIINIGKAAWYSIMPRYSLKHGVPYWREFCK